MPQTARLGLVALETDLQDFLNEGRLNAARAFRVLRDLGQIHPAAELDFIVRAPGEGRLTRFGHPGIWSVSLEPKVTVVDAHGRLIAGERAAVAPIEEYLDLFQRRPDLAALARFNSSRLDAWARSGQDFPFAHMPVVRASLHQGLKVYDRGSTVAALEPALSNNFAGVLHVQGGAVVAGAGVLQLAELILQIEQAAEVELLSDVKVRGDEISHRAVELRALSWV